MLETIFYWLGAAVLFFLLLGCIPLSAKWAWDKYLNAVYGWANVRLVNDACREWERKNPDEYQRRKEIADAWTLKQWFSNLRKYKGVDDEAA